MLDESSVAAVKRWRGYDARGPTHRLSDCAALPPNIRVKISPEERNRRVEEPKELAFPAYFRFGCFSFFHWLEGSFFLLRPSDSLSSKNTALKIFLWLPSAPACARIFFLRLLRNKVAILLHCLYKPSRILISPPLSQGVADLPSFPGYIFFHPIFESLGVLAEEGGGLKKCLVVYILMRGTAVGGAEEWDTSIGNWE